MKLNWGFPFTGFVSGVARFLADRAAITGDSLNWLIDPNEGKLIRRRGSSIVGDTLSGANEVAGILEAKWGASSKKLFELPTPTLTYPTHAVLYTDEDAASGTPTAVKHEGQVYFYSADTVTKNLVIGKWFGSTHYDNNGPSLPNMRHMPLAYSDSDGVTGMTRSAFEEARRHIAPGSRNVVVIDEHLHMPNFQGTPAKWDMRFNSETASGSEVDHLSPIGHLPPLWCPIVTEADGGGLGTGRAWSKYDTFYVSCMFEYEDGSYSMPCIPRAINATLTSGFGRVSLGAASDTWGRVEWRNIPKGGPGVVRTILLRTPKTSAAAVTGITEPNIADLRIVTAIDADRTSYDDPNGSDSSLVTNNQLVRYDHVWPDRGRSLFTFKERACIAYLKPQLNAIILAPVGSTTAYDKNLNENDFSGTTVMDFRVTTTKLVLEHVGVGTTPLPSIASGLNLADVTLQQLVDLVNATVVGGADGRMWRAQLVPGADGSVVASNLMPTTQTVANCSVSAGDLDTVTTATANGFADVAIGMKVTGHANIAADTHVVKKNSSTSVDVSPATAAGGFGPVSLVFSVDTGDDTTVGTVGSIISFCGALPATLCFKDDYVSKYKTRKRGLIFTGASPGHAKNATENYYKGNGRSVPGRLGFIQGGADLPGSGAIFCTKGTCRLVNSRGNDTGDDGDYRVEVFNPNRGCISPYSIVEGDGWAGFLSDQGFIVMDDRSEAIISRAVWNASTLTGTWGYAINVCRASSKSDGTDYPFKASVEGGKLTVTFKTDASTWRQQIYDFSQGIAASGLAEVMNGDTPYGWSAPLAIPSAATIGAVTKSDGVHHYAARDTNAGTADGRVDEIHTGHQDNGTAVTATAYTKTDLCDSLQNKEVKHVRSVYKKNGTGLTVAIQTDEDRTAEDTLTPATSGTSIFRIYELPPNSRARSPKKVIEFKIADDGSGSTPPEVFGLEGEIEVNASYIA